MNEQPYSSVYQGRYEGPPSLASGWSRETPTLGKSASPLARSGSTRSWPGPKRLQGAQGAQGAQGSRGSRDFPQIWRDLGDFPRF